MPGLLPIILAGSLIVLAAERVPALNIEPSCRAAAKSALANASKRDENACLRDESDARGKLDQDWEQYTPTQQTYCVRLSTHGGDPSYVELLTCLELAKAADNLPADSRAIGRVNR